MWTTLALAAALGLTPAQADQLSFLNVRSVTGYFGPERQTDKILLGDVYLLVFDIAGFKSDAEGKILYRMALQVTDSRGKPQRRGSGRRTTMRLTHSPERRPKLWFKA